MIVKPGVVRVLGSEIFITRVARDCIKKLFHLLVLCGHLLHESLAISDNISVRFTQLLVTSRVLIVQLLQEVSFAQIYHLNAFISDDPCLEYPLFPALHHLLEAKLTTVSKLTHDTLNNDI